MLPSDGVRGNSSWQRTREGRFYYLITSNCNNLTGDLMNGGDVDDTIKIARSCLAEYNNSLPLSMPRRSLMTADKQVDELIRESDTSG